jgi:crotonobetainyl-CoA:carnitine CoA-transferase CaiB-like acyl-CoA transferase
MKKNLNKAQWIAMFQALGLDEKAMKQWHHLFETRHPEAHQSFLEWLGLEGDEVTQIRQHSR